MNIAIFTNNYLPNPYGVSMSIESFRKEFEKRGHTVYIFAPENRGYVDENKNVFRYPSIDFKYKISFPLAIPLSNKISKKLKELEIDVIHSQHPNLLGWAAERWAKKKNIPLIFTWHTLYDHYSHFVPLIPKKIIAWWSINNAVSYANKCDQIIVPTPSVKKIIEKWGVTNERITAVPTGVDEDLYQDTNRSIIRKQYGIDEQETLLLLISRLTAEKNIDFLFKSVLSALKKNENLKFLVVGGGSEQDALEKIVVESSLKERIFFAGIVGGDVIKNYYAAADIFVHASKSETQGMILTEAMYAGLPVVSVLATGARNIVTNQVNGLLVKENVDAFADAVQKLTSDKNLRMRFSQNAKKIAREFYTASVCGKNMLEVYEEVIKRKKSLAKTK